jgi:branched-chain amino acid transport system substrate-binding protein
VLRRCGDDLTRENVMRVATSLKNVEFPMLLPGVRVSTSPTDYHPIQQFQMMRFNGKNWQFVGDIAGF